MPGMNDFDAPADPFPSRASGERAKAAVRAAEPEATGRLILGYDSRCPGFWHVVQTHSEFGPWVVECATGTVFLAVPGRYAGASICDAMVGLLPLV